MWWKEKPSETLMSDYHPRGLSGTVEMHCRKVKVNTLNVRVITQPFLWHKIT